MFNLTFLMIIEIERSTWLTRKRSNTTKGHVHPKMKIQSKCTHPHADGEPNYVS